MQILCSFQNLVLARKCNNKKLSLLLTVYNGENHETKPSETIYQTYPAIF